MSRITPFLWFDTTAEQAMMFYVSIFPNSTILALTRFTDAGPGPAGSVMLASFSLDGQEFVALNGGSQFTINEAVSFIVDCRDQTEVDYFWEKLAEGGRTDQCGWLKDRFGVSWQIVPSILGDLMTRATPEQATRLTSALFKMTKLNIAALQRAFDGEA